PPSFEQDDARQRTVRTANRFFTYHPFFVPHRQATMISFCSYSVNTYCFFGIGNPLIPKASHWVGGIKAHGSVLSAFHACSALLNSARLNARCLANSAGSSRKG